MRCRSGTRAIPLLTLVGVLTLEYAAYLWIATVFPNGSRRERSPCCCCRSARSIGAMGIQVSHDVSATAGLLLCAAVVTRAWTSGDRFDTARPCDAGAGDAADCHAAQRDTDRGRERRQACCWLSRREAMAAVSRADRRGGRRRGDHLRRYASRGPYRQRASGVRLWNG